jgi:putative membrane-bound dehydrogenase-like protein
MYNELYLKGRRSWQICLFCGVGLFFYTCTEVEQMQSYPFQAPEGFEISQAVSGDLVAFPMFATFDDKGQLFVFEATEINNMGTEKMAQEPSYQIRLLKDTDDNGEFDHSVIFADKLPFPMGGTFLNGSLYVAASPDLLKLTDGDGDDVADQRETLLTGWTLNQNGAILSGPFLGRDGWLYLADARRGFKITTQEGPVVEGKGARIWRCLPDGSNLEWVSGGGFDNSIELIFMPSGETIGTMTYFTDPKEGQRDALMHWVEGGVYPKYHEVIEADSLPLTGELMPVMTKMPRIAPSGLMRYEGNFWGEDYSGNLFSAEFNTGRIMRYQISADGATYRTKNEAFITALGEDIHLTDVLQDADGSMLIIATGGWFIEGCPLSRTAKPDVKGGIYRIKKSNTKDADLANSWGKKIDFDLLSINQLSDLLKDPRYRVAENALKTLVKRGDASIPTFISHLSSGSVELRTAIVFALYKIGSESALKIIRRALADPAESVRVAAARSLGLAKDTESIGYLKKMLSTTSLPLRRQIATALGQIGDPSVAPALLEAMDRNGDRFVEHALIFSLIQLGATEPLNQGLTQGSPRIRSAAMVALDQMKGSNLAPEKLIPLLSSSDSLERKTAIWIAAKHPEWSPTIQRFINTCLDEQEDLHLRGDIGTLLQALSKDENVQKIIAQHLGKGNSVANKLFLLDIVDRSDLSEFPSVWQNQLGPLLSDPDQEIKMSVLKLITSHQLIGLEEVLRKIILSSKQPDEIRLEALKARLMNGGVLLDGEWDFLEVLMSADADPYTRLQIAQILTKSQLSEAQLLQIANTQISDAQPYLIADMLQIFNEGNSEQVGLALVASLAKIDAGLENISIAQMEGLLKSYPTTVKEKAQPFLEKVLKDQTNRQQGIVELASRLSKGDVGEGRKLFYGKAICATCHAVGGEGANFGPDLSNIGEIRSKNDLLEAIVYPGASIAREYDTYRVTSAGNSYKGILTSQTGETIRIMTGPNSEIRLSKNSELSIETLPESMMPAGLDQQMTETELSDLLAFLQALPYRIDRLIEMKEIK